MLQRIALNTQDGATIVGDWYTPQTQNNKAVLLLHMMPATRSSWSTFAQKLTHEGYGVLAIDLRGHGESTNKNGDILDYKKFNDSQHQAYTLDVSASMEFLKEKRFDEKNIAVIGASIGANLALRVLHDYTEVTRACGLSPGLTYRGLTTQNILTALQDNQKVFLAASAEDEYSAQSVSILHKSAGNHATIKHYSDNAGHGTNMFEKHPELMDEIIAWLK